MVPAPPLRQEPSARSQRRSPTHGLEQDGTASAQGSSCSHDGRLQSRLGRLDGQEGRSRLLTRAQAKRSSKKRELHTTVLVVQALRKKLQGSAVKVCTDNVTTMAYINHQGGQDPDLTEIVCPLWEWALQTRTTIFATYILGVDNDRADKLSRRKRDRTDWMLHRNFQSSLSPVRTFHSGFIRVAAKPTATALRVTIPRPGSGVGGCLPPKTHEGAG